MIQEFEVLLNVLKNQLISKEKLGETGTKCLDILMIIIIKFQFLIGIKNNNPQRFDLNLNNFVILFSW